MYKIYLTYLNSTFLTVSNQPSIFYSASYTSYSSYQPSPSHLVHPSPAWSFLTSPSFRIRFYLFIPHSSTHLSRFPAQEILQQLLGSVFKSVLLSTPQIFVLCSFLHSSCSNNVHLYIFKILRGLVVVLQST